MIFNYKHREIDSIIECELDYLPADPENGYMHDSMELISATINLIDILPIMCDSVIKEIQNLALTSEEVI